MSAISAKPVTSVERGIIFDPKTFVNPDWDEQKDFSSALSCLQKGELIYTRPMRDLLYERNKAAQFNNEVHYGIFSLHDTYVAAAYKPKIGEDVSAAEAEQVAYDLYEKLIAPFTGNHLIPPTIVRTMPDGRIASCQFFVETQPHEDMWTDSFRESVFQALSWGIVQELAVFNAIFNNWDRHPGNYLATQRQGRFYLASIDNEGIENKGILPLWGERSFIPAAFTNDVRAVGKREIQLSKDLAFKDFQDLLSELGFQEVPRIQAIYNNVIHRGDSDRSLLIHEGLLSVRYHQQNVKAFPLPKPPYPSKVIEAYKNLTEEALTTCFRPLVELDPRFATRVSDILRRRDMFLESQETMIQSTL